MTNEEILNRLELIYSTNSQITDLRKAVTENNLHSLFRLFENISNDDQTTDLRKAMLNNDRYALFRLLKSMNDSSLVDAMKKIDTLDNFNQDALSQGQIKSKVWLIKELEKLDLNLGTIFLCAGWYAILATMLFESNCKIDKIRSFDIDPDCIEIAEIFNKLFVLDNWKFKAITEDIFNIDYFQHTWQTYSKTNNRTSRPITDSPTTIINTSCEHISDFNEWYSKIPNGKIVVLQTNNYFEIEEHVNCSESLEKFADNTPMETVLFSGELELPKYTRFMRIGFR